jgi:hypothetical protein
VLFDASKSKPEKLVDEENNHSYSSFLGKGHSNIHVRVKTAVPHDFDASKGVVRRNDSAQATRLATCVRTSDRAQCLWVAAMIALEGLPSTAVSKNCDRLVFV